MVSGVLYINDKKKNKIKLFIAAIAFIIVGIILSTWILTLIDCDEGDSLKASNGTEQNATEWKICDNMDCKASANYLMKSIDENVDPCDDFYSFACGNWIKDHPINGPSDSITSKSSQRSFVLNQMHEMLTVNPEPTIHSKAEMNAIKFYNSCIKKDDKSTENAVKVLKNLLNTLGGWPMIKKDWKEPFAWQDHFAEMIKKLGRADFLFTGIISDFRNKRMIFVRQPKMENVLEGYFNPDIQKPSLFYKNLIKTMMGEDADIDQLNTMIEFENKLLDLTKEEKAGSLMTFKQLQAFGYWVNWERLFDVVTENIYEKEYTEDSEIIVNDVNYFKKIDEVVQNAKKRTIMNYLGWKLFLKVHQLFEIKKKADTAICVNILKKNMKFIVEYMYVKNYFREQEKFAADLMIKHLKRAFNVTLENVPWLDTSTKQIAIEKLNAMNFEIGNPFVYDTPEWVNNYHDQMDDLMDDNFFQNFFLARESWLSENILSLNKTDYNYDFDYIDPTVTEAFYTYELNKIELPAGLLQFPSFHPKWTPYQNFGAIGTKIAHEITHGFDIKGKDYDKDGYERNWWSKHILDDFLKRTDCIKNQYSNYVDPKTSLKLNGTLTLADDIADSGAIIISLLGIELFQKDLMDEKLYVGLPDEMSKYSPEKIFFITRAQYFCENSGSEFIKNQIKTSEHSLSRFRVIGSFSNSDKFAEAFNCPVGSNMNPENKCIIW